MDNTLLTLLRWRRVVLHWPKAWGFWPSAFPSCPPTVLSNLVFQWSVHPNSLTLRSATCKPDNLDLQLLLSDLVWMTYNWRTSTMRIKRMSEEFQHIFSYLKALSFQKITSVVRMLHDLRENLFTCVGKIFFHERKYLRHKRITNYSFHTWQNTSDFWQKY